jgi:hypothetical protein
MDKVRNKESSNIREEKDCDNVDWIHLDYYRHQIWALLRTAIKIRVL